MVDTTQNVDFVGQGYPFKQYSVTTATTMNSLDGYITLCLLASGDTGQDFFLTYIRHNRLPLYVIEHT